MGPPPLLSIVVTTHSGRANATAELVNNLSAQSKILGNYDGQLCEIIVVDDASFPPFSPPQPVAVPVIRFDHNIGAPAARRAGCNASKGAFIHFHDSDDQVPTEWLIRIVSALQESVQPDLLITARMRSNGHAQADRLVVPRYVARNSGNVLRLRNYLTYENAIGPLGGVTFSRRAVERLSFPSLASCQDWHMYWEALSGPCFVKVDQDNYFIFQTTGMDRISNSLRRKALGLQYFARLVSASPAQYAFLRRYFWTLCNGRYVGRASIAARLWSGLWRWAAMIVAHSPTLARWIFLGGNKFGGE